MGGEVKAAISGEERRMYGILLIVIISVIMIKVICIADKRARKSYIPMAELMQRYAQPDKYVPWSYQKRMRYYDREQQLNRKDLPAVKPYSSHIETGNTNN